MCTGQGQLGMGRARVPRDYSISLSYQHDFSARLLMEVYFSIQTQEDYLVSCLVFTTCSTVAGMLVGCCARNQSYVLLEPVRARAVVSRLDATCQSVRVSVDRAREQSCRMI